MNVQMPTHTPSHRDERFQSFELVIHPFREHEFHVIAFEGREAISELFEFEVLFTCIDVLDPTRVAGQKVYLTLRSGHEELVVAGIVSRFDCEDPRPSGDFVYRVAIGPRFGLTDFSKQNLVIGGDTPLGVRELIHGKLNNNLSAGTTGGRTSYEIDVDLRLMSDYPRRDHITQFEETDFAFLSRTCEHNGIFYFFEHASHGETIVFADSNVALRAAGQREEHLYYRATRGHADDMSVSSFRATAKPVARNVYVRDFDDTQASTQLLAQHVIDEHGFGAIVEYGPNFNTPEMGHRFAQIRAEELAAQKVVYHGVSTAPGLRPGTYFTLADHPNARMDGKYVVVAVTHSAGEGSSRGGPYENRFEAIRFETPYRPRRKTARPVASGLFNATIDSGGNGFRADIDGSGRYRVRHVYDEANSKPGLASGLVRQAQPYTGKQDTGFILPLLKDTGVVIGYLNGDPDRPIIVGAMPDSIAPSIVSHGNAHINRLRTPAGLRLELFDGETSTFSFKPDKPGFVRLVAETKPDEANDFPNSSYFRLGGFSSAEETPLDPSSDCSVTSSTVDLETYDNAQDYQQASLQNSADKGQLTSAQAQDNTTSQNLQKAAVSTTARTPLNSGILMYSDKDLQINTKGAAYMEFQSGHATLLTGGDSYYTVKNGQLVLSATNGLTIQAGTLPNTAVPGVAAKAGVRATDAVIKAANQYNDQHILIDESNPWAVQPVSAIPAKKASAGVPADLYIYASNNINQKAYGPLDEQTYGDSYKSVHGKSTEYFFGTSYKETHSTATEIYYGAKTSWVFDADVTGKIAASLSMFVGIATNMKLSAELNLTAGAKVDMLLAASLKMVAGMDISIITSGTKIVFGDDLKVVSGIDIKNVQVDSKVCEFFMEMKGLDLNKKLINTEFSDIDAKTQSLQNKLVGMQSKVTSLSSIL